MAPNETSIAFPFMPPLAAEKQMGGFAMDLQSYLLAGNVHVSSDPEISVDCVCCVSCPLKCSQDSFHHARESQECSHGPGHESRQLENKPKHAQFAALTFLALCSHQESSCFVSFPERFSVIRSYYSTTCEIQVPGVDKGLQVVQLMLQNISHHSDPCT